MKGEALATIRAGAGADILYLEPPYAATLDYAEEYETLDIILGDHLMPSPFSTKDGLDSLLELLGHARAYPLWVISYGNAVVDLATLVAAVEQFRPARGVEIRYSHMNAVATKAKQEKNREFIILAGEAVQ